MNEPEKGTDKAKDLLRMAVARAHYLVPLETYSMPITRSALVIGGGIAGMECASNLADQGVETHLVEQAPALGGRLNELNYLAHLSGDPLKLISEKAKKVRQSGVKVYTNSKLVDIQGYVGNFDVSIEQASSTNKSKSNTRANKRAKTINITTGAIVLAIGSGLYNPETENEYGYGKYSNVITNQELEARVKTGKLGKKTKNIVFIQCVGARESHKKDGNLACSRYCCQTTLNQAVELQKAGANVTILHKGIRAFSKYAEELYYTASQLGVRFIEFPEAEPPVVIKKGAVIKVTDLGLRCQVLLPTDLTVLTTAMIPNEKETEELQDWLKVPRSSDGFFMELHPKLGPVETNTVGIYLCGCAQGPKDITDSLNQASGAAAKVAALFSNKELTVEPITACVDERVCWGCGTCEELCPYGAVQIGVTDSGVKLSRVNSALCKGCGLCSSNCPSGAMSIKHYSNLQISSMIEAFGEVVE
jgi:heterodisulfide reductase subunit A